MNPLVAAVIKNMEFFRGPGNYIPYRRYLLQVVMGGRVYSIQRYKEKKTALAEKEQIAVYRGIRPVIVDTKTGLEVSDEN